jgi:superoxide dismutase, Fe-Mn family
MRSKTSELIGNFEITNAGAVTRREMLIMGAVAATTAAASGIGAQAATANPTAGSEPYAAKDFSDLASRKLEGISASQIDQHLKLYQGYIKKSNEIYNKLKDVDITTANATYSPLRELLMEQSYAVNGAIYHEFYFANLGGKDDGPAGDLKAALEERWGSTSKFIDYLKAAGKSMRGWVVIGYNTRVGHLDAFGLDFHNMWSPANTVPIIVLDVYEHAYMVDYGIDRAKYLDAFVKNLDWDVVSKRFTAVKSHPSGPDTTA